MCVLIICPVETEEQQEEKKEKKEEVPGNRPFLYVLNLVRTKHIPGVKRGARTKAMAICTQHQHVHIFKPLLLLALDEFFEKPEERYLHELLWFPFLRSFFLTPIPDLLLFSVPKSVYNAINNMDFQLFPTLNQQEKKIIRASENTDEKRHIPPSILLACFAIVLKSFLFFFFAPFCRYFKTKVSYGIDLPMKVPVVMYPDEVGDV